MIFDRHSATDGLVVAQSKSEVGVGMSCGEKAESVLLTILTCCAIVWAYTLFTRESYGLNSRALSCADSVEVHVNC